MAEMRSGNGHGLLEFLDWAATKHEIPRATAQNLRLAATRVLEVEEDLESIDLRQFDIDDLSRRFEIKSGSRYNTASLQTYKSRFRSAVTMYTAWLAGDPGWRGNQRKVRLKSPNGGPPKSKSSGDRDAAAPMALNDQQRTPGAVEPSSTQPSKIVQYTMPLRPNLLVHLSLPVDLTHSDAERVAKFVKSLAFGDPSEPPSEDLRRE